MCQDKSVANRPRDPNQLAKLIVVSDHIWSLEEIAMLSDAAAVPVKRGPYKKRATA